MAGTLAETATPEEKAEHDKLVATLKRFNTPADAAKKMREQEKFISSGQIKRPLAKNATADQIKAWRTENGIPEDPSKYELGVAPEVLDDNTKPVVEAFVKDLHGANASPEVVKASVAALIKQRDAVREAMTQHDAETKTKSEDELRAEWGNDYRTNIAGIESLLGQADSEVKETILTARGADGVSIANNPKVLKWLAGHARELGYVGATVVPSGGDLGKGVDDEIKAIEDSMFNKDGTKSSAYWASEKQQSRYSALLESKNRFKGKEN